jgi:hypothetical protein
MEIEISDWNGQPQAVDHYPESDRGRVSMTSSENNNPLNEGIYIFPCGFTSRGLITRQSFSRSPSSIGEFHSLEATSLRIADTD